MCELGSTVPVRKIFGSASRPRHSHTHTHTSTYAWRATRSNRGPPVRTFPSTADGRTVGRVGRPCCRACGAERAKCFLLNHLIRFAPGARVVGVRRGVWVAAATVVMVGMVLVVPGAGVLMVCMLRSGSISAVCTVVFSDGDGARGMVLVGETPSEEGALPGVHTGGLCMLI